MRTPLWHPPLTFSSSSSSSSSARLRWKASNYNASCSQPFFSPLLIYAILPTAMIRGSETLGYLLFPGHHQRDQHSHMIMEDLTSQEHTCPTWVKFCSLVSQFVKGFLILSRVWIPSHFSGPQHLPKADYPVTSPFIRVWNPFSAHPCRRSDSVADQWHFQVLFC